ncbi:tetratricopeptide repeat protein, partial [Acinetobacter baumannii]
EAIQCFDQAIQNNPDCAEYYALKASCLYGQELFEQALNEYLKAEKLEPAEASYRLSVAMCLSRLNRFEEAKREIAAAHRNHGENTALS